LIDDSQLAHETLPVHAKLVILDFPSAEPSDCVVLDRSIIGIVVSNLAPGMDYVRVFLSCDVLCKLRPSDTG